MTARLCKETRSLLPLLLFGAPILAACAVLDNGACLWLATTIYCLLCAVVGIGAMGFELVHGMQANLFAQPISRETAWRDKLLVQTGALLLLGAVYAWVIAQLDTPFTYETRGTLALAAVAPLAAVGGGSLLVLALRHVQAAFVMLIAVAVGLHFAIEALWPVKLVDWRVHVHVVSFVVFAGAGIFYGRKKFVEFQNYSLLQSALAFAPEKNDSWAQNTGVTKALFKKELALYWVYLAMLGAIFVAGLCFGDYGPVSVRGLIKELVFLLLPCFVGAAAISEERRLGVHRWHVTLPPNRRWQWFVKLLVAFALVLIGVLFYALWSWFGPKLGEAHLTGGVYLIYALVATPVALMVSSLSRHFVQAAAISCVLTAGLIVLFYQGAGSEVLAVMFTSLVSRQDQF